MTNKSGILKVQVLSDLHAENEPDTLPLASDLETNADIVLVPGDISRAGQSVQIVSDLFPNAVIALVGGNHEHYMTEETIDQGLARMHQEAERLSYQTGRDIVVLENEVKILEVQGISVRLVGATLWTDYALLGDPVRHRMLVTRALNDYRCIRGAVGNPINTFLGGYSDFSTVENLNRHDTSRAFLERTLREFHDGPTFVLTHHLPSLNSVSPRYKDDPISAGFASRMDDVLALNPTLWVHGHTHDSCMWRAPEGTLVVCNPAGYAQATTKGYGRENERFNPKLVVDIRRGAPDNLWKAGV